MTTLEAVSEYMKGVACGSGNEVVDEAAMMKRLRRCVVRDLRQLYPGYRVRTKSLGVVDGNYKIDVRMRPPVMTKVEFLLQANESEKREGD